VISLPPEGFVSLEKFGPNTPEIPDPIEHYVEIWQFWRIKGSNELPKADIDGLRYSRVDYQAVISENGEVPADSNGKRIYKPDFSKGIFHQENGYILSH
jgi:hypothetical protein